MEYVKNFEKKNKPQFNKYLTYIKDNDWTEHMNERDDKGKIIFHKWYVIKDLKLGSKTFQGKDGEYKVQHKIVETVLNRLSYFVKKTEEDKYDKRVRRVVKQMTNIIKLHLKRLDKYLTKSSIDQEYEIDGIENDEKKTEKDFRLDEIDFDNLVYKGKTTIEDKIASLNIDEENINISEQIEFLNDVKAPLSMHHVISNIYPEINKKLESMGIDFETPPKNEMLIYMDNIPEWNENKHYFDQDPKTLQFFVDEFKKIRNGIKIGGVYITGWMYSHLNVFKAPIPQEVENIITKEKEVRDIIQNPPLRDNDWFIIQDNYEVARKEGKMMFLCATRRAAKTTLIACHLQWKALSMAKTLVVAGGSSKDLGQIEGNFKIALENAHPAFAIPNITGDWSKNVRLGIKDKGQKDILVSTLAIVNLNAGGEKSSEILAGYTPDAFVLDECMKNPFLDQLNAAKPSFESNYGLRLVPILSGTGSGNDDLVADALKVLARPDDEGILNMNWDALERGMDKEDITWERRDFGTFLPGQMSSKVGMIKVKKKLHEYLGVKKTKGLDKIDIFVTDWPNCNRIIREDREKIKGNKKSLQKEIVYFPIDPEEIFLSGKTNPFPQEEIKKYLDKLKSSGDLGKKVVLDYDDKGKVYYELTDKDYAELPFGGGFHDAPITIYEDPIENPPFEFYISSLDDYAQEQADSDSLGSYSIMRRDNKKIVATYHSRPDPHRSFHRQGLMLLELYNAPCFMENANMEFKSYTDSIGYHCTDKFIVKRLDFLGDMSWDSNVRREYGWTPTPRNKSYLMGLVLNYFKETYKELTEEGKEVTRWGFERIKDERILREAINYKPGGNFDTISSLMGLIGYDYYLTYNYGAPKLETEQERLEREKREKLRRKSKRRGGIFPQTSGSIFR